MTGPAVTLVASGFGALEGPTVDDAGGLLVGDLHLGGVHRIEPDGTVRVVLPDRRAVGGICLHAAGGIVVSGDAVTHVRDGSRRDLLELGQLVPREHAGAVGFNDLAVDRVGRVLAGVLRRDPDGRSAPGEVVRISGPGRYDVVHGDLHPNGMAFSPDGTRLYLADTFRRRLVMLDVAADDWVDAGEISTVAVDGLPDGVAVDVEGGIWVAFYRGGCVARFDPLTGHADVTPLPMSKTLSLCFVGPGVEALYVVTARTDPDGDDSGCVYRVTTAVSGAPVSLANV